MASAAVDIATTCTCKCKVTHALEYIIIIAFAGKLSSPVSLLL